LVLFFNIDVANFIFTWNLTIGELIDDYMCSVNTSHMIS